MPGERSTVPTEDRVGLNHLQTSPPTGPESVQQNPQQPVAAVEAQATRRVLLKNRELVTEREDLPLQGSAGSKTEGCQSKKGDARRAHRGSHHDLTNDRNFCVFSSDGVFSNHTHPNRRSPVESSHCGIRVPEGEDRRRTKLTDKKPTADLNPRPDRTFEPWAENVQVS
jgi:hypothetical protein